MATSASMATSSSTTLAARAAESKAICKRAPEHIDHARDADAAVTAMTAKATALVAYHAEAEYQAVNKAAITALDFSQDTVANSAASAVQMATALQAAITAHNVSLTSINAMDAAFNLAVIFDEEAAIKEEIVELPPHPPLCWYCWNEEDDAAGVKSYAYGWVSTRNKWRFVCMQCHYWFEENGNNTFQCL